MAESDSDDANRGWLARVARRSEPLVAHPLLLALLLLGIALAARAAQFGNPVVHVDDQFYLLAGERLLGGALPFIDIWDRKPVGLFLLYAGLARIGGDGVLGYQLAATLAAVATAWGIARIARPIAGPHPAAAAAVVYLMFLGVFGGEAGQAPVFYNLLTVLAAWAMVGAVAAPGFGRRHFALGLAATALMGLAIQVKYSVAFEGAFFGLALLWKARREGATGRRLAAMGTLWLAAGLAPTLAAWGYYAARGAGEAFVYANFVSIFARGGEPLWAGLKRLVWIAALLSPLVVAALLARHRPWDSERACRARYFVGAWAVAAAAGVLVFGSYFDHYALPLLPPLCIAAAPLFGDARAGIAVVATGVRWRLPAALALILYGAGLTAVLVNDNRRARGWGPQVAAIAGFVAPRLQGCLFVHEGDVALYRMTRSCLPTRWPFPGHLGLAREDGAIGVDTLAEVKRIMAERPFLVVSTTTPDRYANRRTWDFVRAELARAYTPVFVRQAGSRALLVYQRRPGM